MEVFIKAIKKGDIDTVESELSKGVDVNAKDRRGDSAIIIALHEGHDDISMLLLSRGASLNDAGGTPLLITAVCGGASQEVLEEILKKKIIVNATDGKGRTALLWALESNNLAAAQALIQASTNVNQKDSQGLSALHVAAQKGITNAIKLLIQRGADPNCLDSEGNTALHLAIAERRTESIAALIAAGVPLNVVSKAGFTALHDAAQMGDLKSVAALIAAGCDLHILCPSQHSALDYGIASGVKAVSDALRAAGGTESNALAPLPPLVVDPIPLVTASDKPARIKEARKEAVVKLSYRECKKAYTPPPAALLAALGAGFLALLSGIAFALLLALGVSLPKL